MKFCHLHVHTHYSLLDGLCNPKEMAQKAKSMGHTALAITDHGNMFGAIDFYTACKDVGIKPIIGLEVYVAPVDMKDRDKNYRYDHLTLLAMNNTGYKNLIILSTLGYTQGFYYRPRIDMDTLCSFHEGIIILSGCMFSRLSRLILAKDFDEAERDIMDMQRLYGDRYYLEVQDFGIPGQDVLRSFMPTMSVKHGIPIVCTNDIHYLTKEDVRAHEALLCIGTGKTLQDKNRLRFDTTELYMKSADEMNKLWPKEYIEETQNVADRCNLEIKLNEKRHIFEPISSFKLLKEKCDEKMQKIKCYSELAPHTTEKYVERYEQEIKAIEKTGYAEYIMVVADFMEFAKTSGVPIGSGRGSSAGSLVCFLLGITDIDPIRFGLLFERFINIDRIEPPDIDVDICQARRGEVIQYIKDTYGQDRVAQIITFGSLKARATIRDVCRVLGHPWIMADTVSKRLGYQFDGTVQEALMRDDVRSIMESQLDTIQYKEFCDIATRVEGKLRHQSTHAAGIVISDTSLSEVTPLYKHAGQGDLLTQYDMLSIGKLGLLKFDILGLRTITVIAETCKSANINNKDIPLDDRMVYGMLSRGTTCGIFQYEGWGYTRFIKRMMPKTFNDLIALGALYRPGPLNSGMADDYIKRMHGQPYIKNEILDETYGIMLYQEQIMQIVVRDAGFTLNEADTLRKAIGKKDQELMDKMLPKIKDPVLRSNIVTFARYGWNKAHAVSYALLSYQTAWLRFNYPEEFWCAILNSEIGDRKRLDTLLTEAIAMDKVKVEQPHINVSDRYYKLHNNILYSGLLSIKGVGRMACDAILEERTQGKYTNEDNFRERLPAKLANKTVYEALLRNNAFRMVEDRW